MGGEGPPQPPAELMARRKVTNVRERQRKRVPAIPEQASASRKSPEEEKEEDCAVEQVRPRAAGSAHAPRSGRARAWRVLVSVRMRITERAWSPVRLKMAHAHGSSGRAWCLSRRAAPEISSSNPGSSVVLAGRGRMRRRGVIPVFWAEQMLQIQD